MDKISTTQSQRLQSKNMKLLFIGASTPECSFIARSTLEQHPQFCCPPPLDLISEQSDALQNFDVAQPFLKEYQIAEEDYLSLFKQMIIKILQNYPNRKYASVLAETSHENHLNFATLYRLFPEARFTFILRDGRDVIISLLRDKINKGSEITLNDITKASVTWLNAIGNGLNNLHEISKLGAATNTIKIESLFNSQVSDPLILDFFNKLEIDSFSFSKNPIQQIPDWKKILNKPQIDILINETGQILNQLGYLSETSW